MELLEPAVSEPKHGVWFGTRLAPYQIIPTTAWTCEFIHKSPDDSIGDELSLDQTT